MPERADSTDLNDRIVRLEKGAMYVDIVKTSQGLLRVGSMPDISKITARFGLREKGVIVPDWTVSQAGDNYTGEEFVLWHAQMFGSDSRDYIGTGKNLQVFHRNLARIFPYYFDRKRRGIVRKRWMARWMERCPVETSREKGSLKVQFKQGNVLIYDGGRQAYDMLGYRPSTHVEDLMEEVLSEVPPDSAHRDHLEITVVGSGNGFFETTSSFLVRLDGHVLWIDPCAQPAHSLANVGVHWDDVTDVLITHNHEDHILGFTACLKRKIDRKEKLSLLTSRNVYEVMKKQFSPLFPEMDRWIDLTEIKPGQSTHLGEMKILSRWNHHFLPYGTLGIKINGRGRTWGLSGDTRFDSEVNRLLKREELSASWFGDCDLVFHEVDFDNPGGVHSYWEEVAKIQKVVSCELLAYHTAPKEDPPIAIAREGKTYRLL